MEEEINEEIPLEAESYTNIRRKKLEELRIRFENSDQGTDKRKEYARSIRQLLQEACKSLNDKSEIWYSDNSERDNAGNLVFAVFNPQDSTITQQTRDSYNPNARKLYPGVYPDMWIRTSTFFSDTISEKVRGQRDREKLLPPEA